MAKGYISKIRLKHRKLQAKHQSLKTNTFYVDLGSSHPCQGLIIEFTSQSFDFLLLLGHMTCLGQQKGSELMVLPFPNVDFQEPCLFFFILLCTCYFLDHEKNLPRLACWFKQDRRCMEQNQPRPAGPSQLSLDQPCPSLPDSQICENKYIRAIDFCTNSLC